MQGEKKENNEQKKYTNVAVLLFQLHNSYLDLFHIKRSPRKSKFKIDLNTHAISNRITPFKFKFQ